MLEGLSVICPPRIPCVSGRWQGGERIKGECGGEQLEYLTRQLALGRFTYTECWAGRGTQFNE